MELGAEEGAYFVQRLAIRKAGKDLNGLLEHGLAEHLLAVPLDCLFPARFSDRRRRLLQLWGNRLEQRGLPRWLECFFAGPFGAIMLANPVNQFKKDRAVFLNTVGLTKGFHRGLQQGRETAVIRKQALSKRLNILLRDCIGQ